MSKFSIGIIPGDGIGREVTPAAFELAGRAALHFGATLEATFYDWGSDYYLEVSVLLEFAPEPAGDGGNDVCA